MPDTWTIAEAAGLIEKTPQLLQKAIENAPVKPTLSQRAGKRVYVFEMRDLVFFCALDDIKTSLTKQMQGELYKGLMRMPIQAAIDSVEVGSLSFDFKPYFSRVKQKIEAKQRLFEFIDRTGAEPMIEGTDINAYRIAALHGGMTIEEIRQDYPSLTREQVVAARAYAESHPKAGRPYPKITAKRAMRKSRADAEPFLPTRQ